MSPTRVRRILFLCALMLTLVVVACGDDRPSVDAPVEDASPTASTTPQDPNAPIVVDEPAPGSEITSPVSITGSADVFEATVSIRILDEEEKVIAETFTTATCGTGCRGDYSESVRFDVDSPQPGTIEVYEASAEDGSQLFTVRVPVMLVPTG